MNNLFSHLHQPLHPSEAAHPALSTRKHGAGFDDAAGAGLGALGGHDPEDPVAAGDGRDVGPCDAGRCRCGSESATEVGGDFQAFGIEFEAGEFFRVEEGFD